MYVIQRNSLIGSGEAKTQNSGSCGVENRPESGPRAFLRPLAAVLILTVCSILAANREPSFVPVEGDLVAVAPVQTHAIQRADIIDDIIDVIDKIINPPPPEEEDP